MTLLPKAKEMNSTKSYVHGEIVKTFSDLVYILRDGRLPKPKEIDDLYKHLIRRLGLSQKGRIMTITSSGAKCDICGSFILPFPGELVNCFGITGIKQELHCDNRCKKILQSIGDDWTKLPEGPLKKAFEGQNSIPTSVKETKQ